MILLMKYRDLIFVVSKMQIQHYEQLINLTVAKPLNLSSLEALGKPACRHRYCLYCTKRLKDLIGKLSCLEPRPNSWHLPYYFPAELDVSTCAFLINFPRRGVSSLSAFSGITALHAHESRLNRQLHFTLPGMESLLRYKR